MTKYKCLIVDDEQLARDLLESYVNKIEYLELVETCSSAIEAMQVLQQQEIDILFLDIHMPDLSGIELLKMLKKRPATIFTTAYSEYALEGYELEVVDYLVKPIEFDRFFKAVSKAMGALQKNQPILLQNRAPIDTQETYFFVKSDAKIIRIAFDDVLFIEALQKYIRIYTTKEKITTLLSITKVLELLPAQQFYRIHRSYVLNIDKIDNIEGNMVKIGPHTLTISKGQREGFFEVVKSKGFFQ